MDKQHIIYKITNVLNNRFYVGMHTGFLDDGYLGSGKRLKAEIKKYGKENFKREILEILPDRKSLESREAEIVSEELLVDPLCLNLKNGGEGGGKFWNETHQQKCSSAGGRIGGKITGKKNANIARQKMLETRTNFATVGMTGRKHSEETKRKMREAHRKNRSE